MQLSITSLVLVALACSQVARTMPIVIPKTEDEIAAIGVQPLCVFKRTDASLEGARVAC
ncbi:hypothetical protein BV25DRAFT_1819776 [Artomyces pyxidatus]|uniref:Uncharacterized protein n=1 Tax=Artomyces pyxidatus TaxID=48021 RepID=A0ACB8TG82_9AGAM|nr:hypothetical protein BV25DRAFT_1819776 [Artomyces pyxidatus]